MHRVFGKDADAYVPARAVWERFGITDMSLWRWLRDERMAFPKPVYFGRFRYFKVAEINAWERGQVEASTAKVGT